MSVYLGLTPQELRLIEHAAAGTYWQPDRQEGVDLDLDATNAQNWDASRTVRAAVLRCLATGETWPGAPGPWPVSAKGLKLFGAAVADDLDLVGATVMHALWLHHCSFERISLSDSHTKLISLAGSFVGEMNAYRAHIEGSLYLRNGFHARRVNISGSTIDGQLDCTDATFENPDGTTLDADGATVRGGVYLSDGFTAKGKVALSGLAVTGQLDCSKAKFEAPGKAALSATGVDVSAELFLSDSTFTGRVDLYGAVVGNNLYCSSAKIENPGAVALNLTSASIGGNLYLARGFSAKGQVLLTNADINGQLICRRGMFELPQGVALMADAVKIGSDVFLNNGFSVKGQVNFYRAEIKGNLHCEEGSFASEKGDALDLTLAKIHAGLFLCELTPPPDCKHGLRGKIRLSQATCHIFRDDRKSWPAPGALVLDGFTYERFHNCATDWRARRDWLRLQDGSHIKDTFRPQPWMHAIGVLRKMGHDGDAKALAIACESARTRSRSTPLLSKLWHFMLWLFVGYGYRPWLAVWWSLALVLVAWWVFASAASLGYMAPRDGNVRVSQQWNEPARNASGRPELPATYPSFNGLVFALDDYLPVIEFGQDDVWEPATKKTIATAHAAPDLLLLRLLPPAPEWLFASGWHRVIYWIWEVLGWVFISLFIAGMSGLMKKE